jgi:hypothetical protein
MPPQRAATAAKAVSTAAASVTSHASAMASTPRSRQRAAMVLQRRRQSMSRQATFAPLLSKAQRARAADPAGRAGDDDDLPGKAHRLDAGAQQLLFEHGFDLRLDWLACLFFYRIGA